MLADQIISNKVFILLMAGLIWQPIPAIAEWSLDVYGKSIALGMDRQTVLTRLENYRFQCLSDPQKIILECNSILVQNAMPPNDFLANVFFKNDKVSHIRKYWSHGYEGGDLGKFFQIFYSLLAKNNQQPVQVSVGERRDPGFFQQVIYLTSGRRTIEIAYIEDSRNSGENLLSRFIELSEVVE